MRVKLTGWKAYEGNIDGKDIDSGSVYVEMPLDTSNGRRAAGTASAMLKCPNSAVIVRIEKNPLPFIAEVEMEDVTDGKGGFKQIVKDVRPLPDQKSAMAEYAASRDPFAAAAKAK